MVFQADTGPLGCPCNTMSIIGDGNCFFRAVSQAVCGTQKAHRAVRLAVVKDMELHSTDYKNMLRCEYTPMEDYLSTSRMKYFIMGFIIVHHGLLKWKFKQLLIIWG